MLVAVLIVAAVAVLIGVIALYAAWCDAREGR